MESKKINKKINSIFWGVLGALPLLILLISFVGYLAVYKETGSVSIFDSSLFESALVDTTNICSNFSWNIVHDTLVNTFNSLGFTTAGTISQFVIVLFAWMVTMSFIHLFIDFLLFIPRLFHNIVERWS